MYKRNASKCSLAPLVPTTIATLLAGTLAADDLQPFLEARPLMVETLTQVPIGSVPYNEGMCRLGGSQSVVASLPNFIQDDDSYFTLLEPSTCSECSATGTMTVERAYFGLWFSFPCELPTEVSIVEAFEGLCPTPDVSRVLMPPVRLRVLPSFPGPWLFIYTLPDPVCLRGPAFLRVTLASTDACEAVDLPQLTYGDGQLCAPCRFYRWGGNDQSPKDLCLLLDGIEPDLQQGAIGSCCKATPVQQESWGRLKIRYRAVADRIQAPNRPR